MATVAVAVLGASGSVGDALIARLVTSKRFEPIISFCRRSQPRQIALAKRHGAILHEVIIDPMHPAALEKAVLGALASVAQACGASALGVGANTARLSIDEHRAVDVALNAAFARALKASKKVTHLALMSAVGANAKASARGPGMAGLPRYARVKGEAELAALCEGPSVVSILRPATIVGSRHTPWAIAKLSKAIDAVVPDKYRSITTTQIADAMVALLANAPSEARIFHHREMLALRPPA